jgi:branched-chain amino acid transport system ATP-binding protein
MLLEVEDVHVHYGKVEALKGVSLAVDDGEIVTLIGANGAGKTTTLKTISGLRPVTSGSVRFRGRDITTTPGYERVEMGLCQAPEGRGIFPGMSVTENLEMGAYARSRTGGGGRGRARRAGRARQGDMRADFDRVFDLFPRLAERRSQPGGTLSGGEQQMLAIGRALMARPQLLLLDEPSMGLAPKLVVQIFEIIREISAQGTPILVVEQNAAQALALANRAYVLETGQVVRSADARSLLSDDSVRAAYLGGTVEAGSG